MKLMTHLVAGYPNLVITRESILTMQNTGADILELQLPFSDPLGDGPVIQKACAAALKNGLKIHAVFDLLKNMKEKNELTKPLYLMAYFNSVYHFTIKTFCAAAKDAGAEGLIIPDYAIEAETYDHLFQIAEKYNLNCIRFLSLDSSEETMRLVANSQSNFVYCFSMRGVTGGSPDDYSEVLAKLKKIKQIVNKPLAIGFGISAPEQIKLFHKSADIAIVGSAFIRAFESEGVRGIKLKVQELASAL